MKANEISADEAQDLLLVMWDEIKGTNGECVCNKFKERWNALADVARQKHLVPKYPPQ